LIKADSCFLTLPDAAAQLERYPEFTFKA